MRVASRVERSLDDAQTVAVFEDACVAFFERELANPDSFLRTWVAVDGTEVVGGASLTVFPTLPRYGVAFGGFDGRVRDVYVQPAHRRYGIARELMRVLIEEAGRIGLDRLTLGASEMGRPLYLSVGFEPKTDEMQYAGKT
jgi:GNAT superfamily N-acetyltransferase